MDQKIAIVGDQLLQAVSRLEQHMSYVTPKGLWTVIWKLKVPQKIRTFLWLTQHGKLMTNHERFHRGMSLNQGSIPLLGKRRIG